MRVTLYEFVRVTLYEFMRVTSHEFMRVTLFKQAYPVVTLGRSFN